MFTILLTHQSLNPSSTLYQQKTIIADTILIISTPLKVHTGNDDFANGSALDFNIGYILLDKKKKRDYLRAGDVVVGIVNTIDFLSYLE